MTDHPDYRALLAGVCETPDDDLPRLVLADWLDELGDAASAARAEFIRAQVELAGRPRVTGDYLYCRSVDLAMDLANRDFAAGVTGVNSATGPTPRCRCANCRLLRRERDLLARWRIDWDREVLAAPHADWQERFVRNATDAPPAPWQRPGLTAREMDALILADTAARSRPSPDDWLFRGSTLDYSRGFVTRLTLPAAAFAEYGAALLDAAPVEQVAFPNLGVRVDIAPPGEGHEWEAYFHSAANAGYIAMDLWGQRHEVAAGISAVVAGWPELATA